MTKVVRAGGSAPSAAPLDAAPPGATRPGSILARTLLAAGLALFALQVLRTAWVSDDAFITLRTVDNLVHGHGLRWNVAERVQTFTHPLWLALIAIPYSVLRDPFYAVTLLSFAVSLAAVGLIAFRREIPPLHAVVGIASLLLSKAFVDYSTSGLENPLTHVLLVLFVLRATSDRSWQDKSLGLGVLAGLLGLNRFDLLAIAAPALAVAAVKAPTARTARNLAIGMAPLALWETFALFYYGSFLPNTILAKLATGIPSSELMAQGLRYLSNSALLDPVTLTVVAAALAVAVATRRAGELAVAAGLLLYLALLVKVGGDFMSGRFLTGPFLASVVLLVRLPWPAPRVLAPASAACLLALASLSPRPAYRVGRIADLSRSNLVDASGIADERRYYFNTSGLLNGAPGWKRPTAEAKLRARDILCSGSDLAVEGAVGVTGFYVGPGVHVVDYHGLGDPLLSRMPAVAADPFYAAFLKDLAKGASPRPWRIGHFLRNVPAGYLETVLTGRNAIRDPATAELYERVRRVTRGPLLDPSRLLEIARLLPGSVGAPPATGRPDFRWTDWSEALEIRPASAEAMFQIGEALYNADRFEDADGAYRSVLAKCPTHSLALFGSGNCALQRHDYPAAERLGRRAIESAPELHNGYLVLSFALRGLRRFDEGAAILETLAERDPTYSATALELLGELWMEAGTFEQARTAFRRALDRDPLLRIAGERLRELDSPRRNPVR